MGKVANFKHLFTDTVKPTAAVTRCRQVDRNGDMLTVAGARAHGVSIETITSADVTAGLKTTVVIEGIVELECGGTITPTDSITTDTVGRAIAAGANQAINGIPLISANAASGDRIPVLLRTQAASWAPQVISIPVKLPKLANGDVLTAFTPGFAGKILRAAFAVIDPATTAAKAADLNLEIGTTNVTGGVIALTSANCTPLGAVVAGTAITAANTFTATDTISVEAANVTTFIEGEGVLLITIAANVP